MPPPPPKEETSSEASPGSYSTKRGNDYRIVREELKSAFDGTTVSDWSWAVNQTALEWFDDKGDWPTAYDLLRSDALNQAAANVAFGTAGLPRYYRSDGRYYRNDPLTGPEELSQKMQAIIGLDSFTELPDLSQDEIGAITSQFSPIRRSGGGGGGGGGGAGRQAIPFDDAQLKRQGTDIWRNKLLEDPDNIDTHVANYKKRANGFWTSEGGQLDFQTYIEDQATNTARYKMLYGKKAPWQSDGQYLAQYTGAVAGFGFDQQTALREVEAGASAGVGQAGFTSRLQQGRANFLNNQGTFSQRFAQSVLQSGLAGS